MRRQGLLALAALLLSAPAGAPAQPANSQASQFPAEALVPNDEARRFFDYLSTHVLTDELLVTTLRRLPGAAMAPLDGIIEPYFARGEWIPARARQGLDLRAIIAGRPGGIAGNMLWSDSQFGPAYSYYLNRPIEAFIPSRWVLVGRRGEPVDGHEVTVEIGHVSPKVILAERISYWRRGRTFCRVRAESRLYADPDVPAAEADMIAVVTAMRFLRRMERARACQAVIAVGPERYGARVFDADGYRLPTLERMVQPMQIVPFAQAR